MKPHIIQKAHPVVMSAADRLAWQQLRLQSIGGSDVAALFGMNEYMAAGEIFLLFCGELPLQQKDSMATITGRLLEDDCCELWEYWEGSEDKLVQNFAAGKKVNSGIEVHATCYHPDRPHLHANIDREIIYTYQGNTGILEAKCPRGIAYEKYEAGIPPSHIFQMQHYLNVCDEEYAELVILKDGRTLEVYPFPRNEAMIAAINDKAADFWARITEIRKAKELRVKGDELASLIEQLEPEVDSSPAWSDFLKERFKASEEETTMEGTQEQWEWAVEHQKVSAEAKVIDERCQHLTNLIKNSLREKSIADFGASGKLTWKADKNGKRIFRNQLKLN